MNLNIQFPVTINGKAYNSMDEIPEEFKKLLNSDKFQNLENTITTNKQWNINGVTYSNFDDIPEESKKYFADSDNNGIPDMFEVNQNKTTGLSDLLNGTLIESPQSKQIINSVVSKPSKIKETPLDEFYNQNNYNEKKAGLTIKSTYLLIAFLIIIIVGLAAFIFMSGKI
jgi:hypothetical protein